MLAQWLHGFILSTPLELLRFKNRGFEIFIIGKLLTIVISWFKKTTITRDRSAQVFQFVGMMIASSINCSIFFGLRAYRIRKTIKILFSHISLQFLFFQPETSEMYKNQKMTTNHYIENQTNISVTKASYVSVNFHSLFDEGV